jgi:hypothetical protein
LKVRIATILRENKLWALVSTTMTLSSSKPISLDLHEVKEARVQRIILDGVKYHLIPHLAEKLIVTKEMWDALINLYSNRNMNLSDKFHGTRMTKGESETSYLTRLRWVKDELVVVGEIIPDSELVRIALKGFTKEWDVFVKCVVGRDKLLDWRKLWDEFN